MTTDLSSSFRIFQGQTQPPLDWILIDANGQPIDLTGATAITFKMRPAGSSTDSTLTGTATITSASAGAVRFAWGSSDTATAGSYRGRFLITWSGGGADQTAAEFDIWVMPTAPQPQDLCTVFDVREAMRLPKQLTNSDPQIQAYITMASDRIQNEYGHFAPFIQNTTKRFTVRRNRGRFFPYFLNGQPTSVVLHPESFAYTLDPTIPDYVVEPFQTLEGAYTSIRISPWKPIVSPVSMRFGYAYLDVTASWGYTTVPNAARLATIITVRSWMLRDAASYATTVQTEDVGIAPRPAGTYALPNAAREHLDLFAPTIGVV